MPKAENKKNHDEPACKREKDVLLRMLKTPPPKPVKKEKKKPA